MDKLIDILRFSISDEAAIIGSLAIAGACFFFICWLGWVYKEFFDPIRRR